MRLVGEVLDPLDLLVAVGATGADVVIHSAATVSFDSPLTSAVEINLLGPVTVSHAFLAGLERIAACEQVEHRGTVPRDPSRDVDHRHVGV